MNVIGLTGESRETVLKYMAHQDASFQYTVAIGGGAAYNVRGIPRAFLIGADGTIRWDGHPSSLSDKEILAALREVEKPSGEVLEARARKELARAEALIEEGLLVPAEEILSDLKKDFAKTEAAGKAGELLKKVKSQNQTEYDAQKKIAKLVGGLERPGRTFKGKEAEGLAKLLEKMAQDLEEKAPRSAELAAAWAAILAEPWS